MDDRKILQSSVGGLARTKQEPTPDELRVDHTFRRIAQSPHGYGPPAEIDVAVSFAAVEARCDQYGVT